MALFYGRINGYSPYPSAEINYEYRRDSANMQYRFTGKIFLENNGWYSNPIRLDLYLNGSKVHTSTHQSYNTGWSSSFDSGWLTVSNKTTGTTPFYFEATDTLNTSDDTWVKYKSQTFQLAISPAYFSSKPQLWVNSYSEDSVSFGWSTSENCNLIRYHLDGSSGYGEISVNAKSGTFNISSWGVNKERTIYIEARRSDSSMWTNSDTIRCTTYDYPKPTSMNNFTIGNGATVNLYNPLGRSCRLEILQKNTNVVLGTYSGNGSGTINAEFRTADAINRQYASIPSSKTGKYYCRVTGTISSTTTTIRELDDANNNTYKIAESDAEKPTFDASKIINIVNNKYDNIHNNNVFIKGHNQPVVTIAPMVGNKSAAINNGYYSVSSSGIATKTASYSSSNQNVTLDNIITNSIVVTAVDNRGMSRSATKTVTFVDYNNPYISACDITRQDGTGVYAIVKITGKYTNWSGLKLTNNVQSIKYRYRTPGGAWSGWTAFPSGVSITNSGGNWSITATLGTSFSNTQQYDIQFQFNDLLETVESSVYLVSTANALLWRDLANKRIGINKKPSYPLDCAGDIHSDTIIRTPKFIKEGISGGNPGLFQKTVDLTSLNVNTYYPVVGTIAIPYNGYHFLMESVQLNSGTKPSWATHNSGFSSVVAVIENAIGWGTVGQNQKILQNTYSFCSSQPVSYQQLSNSSRPVFWCRGGAKYFLFTDYDTDWTIYTASTTITEQTVTPSSTLYNMGTLNNVQTNNSDHPIGSIYLSASPTSPASLFGGTWVQLWGRFLYAASLPAGANAGQAAMSSYTGQSVTGTAITINQMPSHTHNFASWGGSGGYGNVWGMPQNGSAQNTVTIFDNQNQTYDSNGVFIRKVGGGATHSHSIPYIEVYVWQRTA